MPRASIAADDRSRKSIAVRAKLTGNSDRPIGSSYVPMDQRPRSARHVQERIAPASDRSRYVEWLSPEDCWSTDPSSRRLLRGLPMRRSGRASAMRVTYWTFKRTLSQRVARAVSSRLVATIRIPVDQATSRRSMPRLRYPPTPNSTRITTRLGDGWLTSRKPAASKTLRGPDAELAPGDLLPRRGQHRIALERPRPPRPREADRGAGERVAHPLPAEARADEEAGDRPDARVRLDPPPAPPRAPGRPAAAPDRPAAARPRTTRPARPRGYATSPLVGPGPPHPACARSRSARSAGRHMLERLPRRQLVALAPADRPLPARPEDRPEVVPRRLVRRHHPDRRPSPIAEPPPAPPGSSLAPGPCRCA